MFSRSHSDDASQDPLVLHLWPLVRQHVIVTVSHAAIALTYVREATEQKGVSQLLQSMAQRLKALLLGATQRINLSQVGLP